MLIFLLSKGFVEESQGYNRLTDIYIALQAIDSPCIL